MTIPVLKYYNQQFYIDNITFPNSIVKKIREDLSLDESIKEVYYQEFSKNNYIIYEDDSKVELLPYDSKFDEIIIHKYSFDFEYKEELFHQQYQVSNTVLTNIKVKDLFESALNEKEQQIKLNTLKELYPSVDFSNQYFFDVLDRLKKSLLKSSDWTQLPDVQESFTEEQKKEWIDYRATLRTLDEVKDPLSVRLPALPKT